MRRAIVVVPLLGILLGIAAPLARYAQGRRHEQTAIDVLERVRAAQDAIHRRTGGYAITLPGLSTACSAGPAFDADAVEALTAAGYGLTVRSAIGAAQVAAPDCGGPALASDYYAAAAPLGPSQPGLQAFAATAQGDVYLAYDGLAPTESDIARGLATPLSQRAAFKIP